MLGRLEGMKDVIEHVNRQFKDPTTASSHARRLRGRLKHSRIWPPRITDDGLQTRAHLDVGCGIGRPLIEIGRFSSTSIAGLNNNDYHISRDKELIFSAG